MELQLRAELDQIPNYVPGAPAKPGEAKLSSNENPYPPLPSVIDAMAQAAAEINRYPDLANAELIEAIAAAVGVAPDRIAVGPGSVGVLAQLLQALCGPGDEVIFAWRSFEAYPILTRITGATAVPIALTPDYRHDLSAMLAAIGPRTKAILLCTPNNPTGPALGAAEVFNLLQAVPSDICVVLDEAYLEFAETTLAAAQLADQFPNLVILRTFSKAYGLAGLRIGYAIAHPLLVRGMTKTAIPFAVNGLVLAAVQAALAAAEELDERVAVLRHERDRVLRSLADQGWRLPESQANFVYFPAAAVSPDAFVAACAAAGLIVRRYGEDGVRVTIAEPKSNDRLLAAAQSVLADARQHTK